MENKYSVNIRVRYQETDQMGVVYHGNYFTWFEVGRTEFFRAGGIPYRDLEELGLYLPVLDCSCAFRSPAHYDDLLTIDTFIKSIEGIRIRLGYEVKRQNVLLACGETVHAFVKKGKGPINMAKMYPQIWQNILGLCNK